MNNILIENIDKVHTTEMGVDRIRKKLDLGDIDVVKWCRSKIMDESAAVTRQEKILQSSASITGIEMS